MKNPEAIKAELLHLIDLRANELGLSKKEFARQLNLSVSATQNMLHGNNMTLERLHELSVILDFNFFRYWAAELPFDKPVSPEMERIRELEIANETLMKLIKS